MLKEVHGHALRGEMCKSEASRGRPGQGSVPCSSSSLQTGHTPESPRLLCPCWGRVE